MMKFAYPLRELLKRKGIDSTNAVWRLHSRTTVYLLILFIILLSASSYIGNPIDCITTASGSVKASMNDYCWILGTYISRDPEFVSSRWDVIQLGNNVGHIDKEQRIYQKYYQWVAFLLAAQAVLFSFPKHLWRCYERNRIAALCDDLTCSIKPEGWTTQRRRATLLYLIQEPRKQYTTYAALFFICELLNFVFVFVNIFLLNFIFGGFWNGYKPAIRALLSLDMDAWMSYNSLVFPKLAKCDFFYVGSSGSTQMMDALCLLPQNILNEKIFAFLWLWFIALAVISGAHLCLRLAQICSPMIRLRLLYFQVKPINYNQLKMVNRKAGIGYWFLLYQMARNVNSRVMRDIVEDLAEHFLEQEMDGKVLMEVHECNEVKV